MNQKQAFKRTARYCHLLELFITDNPQSPYYKAVIEIEPRDVTRKVSTNPNNPIGTKQRIKRVAVDYRVWVRFSNIPGSDQLIKTFRGRL